jgi:hypothetical protein
MSGGLQAAPLLLHFAFDLLPISFHAIPVHEKHLRSSVTPGKRSPARRLTSTPSTPANLRQGGIIRSESHVRPTIEQARTSRRAWRIGLAAWSERQRIESRTASGGAHSAPCCCGRLARWPSYPSPKMAKAAQSADLQAAFKKHEGGASPRREEAGPSHASEGLLITSLRCR